MAWNDTKQAAVDPDNPAANEQFPFSEHNAMVSYLKDKIINKEVDAAAIGADKILVYNGTKFVFQAPAAVASVNDITDVVITSVADNEVLAYDTASSKWINQTAAEVGLALVADVVLEADFNATTFLYATADNTPQPKTIAETLAILSVESGADATDATNVAAAGAVMDADISAAEGFLRKTGAGAYVAIKSNIGAAVAPTVNEDSNDGYAVGSQWYDTTADKMYACLDSTVAAAVWLETTTISYTKTEDDTWRASTTVTEMGYVHGVTSDIQTQLGARLPLAGGTLSGDLNMGDYQINHVDDVVSNDITGMAFKHVGLTTSIILASTSYSFKAYATASMNSNKIISVTDPTAAQDAATKNYADTRIATKELVTSFTNGYGLVYRTASGKFEMEDIVSTLLPIADTTAIVKGSTDGTKQVRFEVDGLSAGVTRVITMPDKDVTLANAGDYLLRDGTQVMTGNLQFSGGDGVTCAEDDESVGINGGTLGAGMVALYGKDHVTYPGALMLSVSDAAGSLWSVAVQIAGVTDTPIVDILHGLDMNAKDIDDIGGLILNDATELTIATGVVTITQSYHKIDTESDDATDDLVTINGGTAGQTLTIRATDGARTVVAKDGTGNLQLSADMSLDNAQDTLMMIYDGTNWLETSRANNGA